MPVVEIVNPLPFCRMLPFLVLRSMLYKTNTVVVEICWLMRL